MKRSTENILKDNQLPASSSSDNSTLFTSSSTDNSTLSTSSSTDNFTARSRDPYIYNVGIIAPLTIGACVFFAYSNKSSHAANKEPVKEQQQQPIKQPKDVKRSLDAMDIMKPAGGIF